MPQSWNHGSGMTTDLWQSQHFLILGTAWYFVLQSIMHHAHVLLWRPIKATKRPTKLITWCVTLTHEHCAGSYVKQRECVCIPEECVTPLPWGDPQTPWLWAIVLCCRCVWSVNHCSENKKQEKKKNEPLELWRDAAKWNRKTVIMLRHRQIMWYINGLKTQTAVWYLRLKEYGLILLKQRSNGNELKFLMFCNLLNEHQSRRLQYYHNICLPCFALSCV